LRRRRRDCTNWEVLPNVEFRAVVLTGRNVHLRPVDPGDYQYLYRVLLAPGNLGRFRFRGQTPSPEQFSTALWEGVAAQFLVESPIGDPIGLTVIYGLDARNSHASFAVASDPQVQGTGVLIEAATLTIDYAFLTWHLRKLYLEVAAYNLSQFASGSGRFFEQQGLLRDHEFANGSWHDLYLFAIDRNRWMSRIVPMIERIQRLTETVAR
jgi:RimJ/RimL family protein N-acetyltransferase